MCREMIVCGGIQVDEVEIHDEENLALVPSLGHQFGEPKEGACLDLSRALSEAEVGSESHRRSSDGHGHRLRHSNHGQVDGHVAHLSGRGLECCVYKRLCHRRSRPGFGTYARSDRGPSVRPLLEMCYLQCVICDGGC